MLNILFIILHQVSCFEYLSAIVHSQDVPSLPHRQLWHPHLYLAKDSSGEHYEIRHSQEYYDVSISFLQTTSSPPGVMNCECRFVKEDLEEEEETTFLQVMTPSKNKKKEQPPEPKEKEININTYVPKNQAQGNYGEPIPGPNAYKNNIPVSNGYQYVKQDYQYTDQPQGNNYYKPNQVVYPKTNDQEYYQSSKPIPEIQQYPEIKYEYTQPEYRYVEPEVIYVTNDYPYSNYDYPANYQYVKNDYVKSSDGRRMEYQYENNQPQNTNVVYKNINSDAYYENKEQGIPIYKPQKNYDVNGYYDDNYRYNQAYYGNSGYNQPANQEYVRVYTEPYTPQIVYVYPYSGQ
ncbi:hypothetical protein SteCoe_1216 [Stentor coeruleus]|uniref:Uncharacterized protein n=1 Tax=Stentor coeruleus TaxID=5963 RepID=A0A1R2D2F2_9CILI|nr:hypothetical protein SteCoe_1216 [Stentor coeruleus]